MMERIYFIIMMSTRERNRCPLCHLPNDVNDCVTIILNNTKKIKCTDKHIKTWLYIDLSQVKQNISYLLKVINSPCAGISDQKYYYLKQFWDRNCNVIKEIVHRRKYFRFVFVFSKCFVKKRQKNKANYHFKLDLKN